MTTTTITRVCLLECDILPGAVLIGEVTLIDEDGTEHLHAEGCMTTLREAEALARKHGVELERS